jgi:hypothetical protein
LSTLLGTLGALVNRSGQKSEGKREKATVFLAVARDSIRRHTSSRAARVVQVVVGIAARHAYLAIDGASS